MAKEKKESLKPKVSPQPKPKKMVGVSDSRKQTLVEIDESGNETDVKMDKPRVPGRKYYIRQEAN